MISEEHSFVHSVVDFKTFIKSSHSLPQDLVKETVEEQGDSAQPCRSPVDTSNLSDVSPANLTWHQIWECSSSIMVTSFWGTPYSLSMAVMT